MLVYFTIDNINLTREGKIMVDISHNILCQYRGIHRILCVQSVKEILIQNTYIEFTKIELINKSIKHNVSTNRNSIQTQNKKNFFY